MFSTLTTAAHNLSCKDSKTSGFEWKIDIPFNDSRVFYSPAFSQKCNYNVVTMWQFSIYVLSGKIYCYLGSLNVFPVDAKFRFFISCNGTPCLIDEQYRIRKFQSIDPLGAFVSCCIPPAYLYNSISVTCPIIAEVNVSDFRNFLLPNLVVKKKIENFKKMLTDKCDIIFDIDGKELTAHKVILAAHSEVFQKMFSGNWKELIDKKVKIESIEYEVFQELLYFIYSGELSDSETVFGIIDDLLMAADKYFINDLKDLCERIMSKNLNVKNGLKYLELANLSNANVLKSEAIQFIVINSDKFLETLEFKTFAESNGKLCFEIMNALSNLKCKCKKDVK